MSEEQTEIGLSLSKFESNYLIELYYTITNNSAIDWENESIQKVVNKELELASVEWHYYRFLHGNNPDELLYFKLLEKFVKNQLPLLSNIKLDQDKRDFIENHVENLIKKNHLIKEKFSEEDFFFICESERYYAKKYYEKYSTCSLGYTDLDIRRSAKSKVAGINELECSFKYRYTKIYIDYEKK